MVTMSEQLKVSVSDHYLLRGYETRIENSACDKALMETLQRRLRGVRQDVAYLGHRAND